MDLFETQSARELFLPEPTFRESVGKTVIASLRRRWRMVVMVMGASLLVAAAYLIFAPRTFGTSTTLRIDIANQSQSGPQASLSGLLGQQSEIIRSTPVIALALSSPETHGLSLWHGNQSRIEFIKSNLFVHPSAESGEFEITFISYKPADAEKILDASAASYIQFAKTPETAGPLADLRDQQQKVDDDLAATRKKLDGVVKQLSDAGQTPESRQRIARVRAELKAMLAQPAGNPDTQRLLQERLDLLAKQSEQNDFLDDQAAQLQADLDRQTTLRDELSARIDYLNLARPGDVLISVINPATTDVEPISPKPLSIIAYCLALGIGLGIVVAITVDLTRDRLHDDADAASLTRTPVLGHISEMPRDLSTPILRGQCVLVKPGDPAAAACRSICSSLEQRLAPGIDKTILITGPGNGQGKSTLAANLAITMARAGKRVALVDAHHYRPMVYKIFSIEDYVGLNRAIDGSLKLDDVLHVTGLHGLEVLPTGSLVEDWASLLNRPEFLAVLTELSDRFDRVIIDGGPAHLDESRIISAFCDATIIAVDPGRCRRRDLKSAVKGLRAVGAKLTGVVLSSLPAPRSIASIAIPGAAALRSRAHAKRSGHLVETA